MLFVEQPKSALYDMRTDVDAFIIVRYDTHIKHFISLLYLAAQMVIYSADRSEMMDGMLCKIWQSCAFVEMAVDAERDREHMFDYTILILFIAQTWPPAAAAAPVQRNAPK